MEGTAAEGTERGTSKFSWRQFAVLVCMLSVGYVAIIPYSLTLEANAIKTLTTRVPLPILIAAQTVQGIVLYSILAGVGLFTAGRIGLGAPILRRWIEGRSGGDEVRRIIRPALLVGVIGSIVLIAIEDVVFAPLLAKDLARLGITIPATLHPPAWQGLLGSLYGPFDEEIVMRLFVLTVLAWVGNRIWKSGAGRPSSAVLWTANILAAVLFGLAHLPATAAAGLPLDPIVISRAVVLNGLLGGGFGWLYFTAGLESAMLAHFSADIIAHVIAPLLSVV
jgi:hypothetical protein